MNLLRTLIRSIWRASVNNMNKLMQCKICGGEAVHIKLFERNRPDCFYRCSKCGYETEAYTSKQNAIKAWNRGCNHETDRC